MAAEFFNVDRPIDEWHLTLRERASASYEGSYHNAAFENISTAYPDIEDYLRDAKQVVTLSPWQRNSFKVGNVDVTGRGGWWGGYPDWEKKIVYYNTARRTLKSLYNTVVIHHTANMWGIGPNELLQRRRGYAALGYHFYVSAHNNDGAFEGRPLECMGSNAGEGSKPGPLNDPDWGKIGIVLQGDFHSADNIFFDSTVGEKQLATLKRLIEALAAQYDIGRLLMHREVKSTDCPGDALVPRIVQMRTELGMRGP